MAEYLNTDRHGSKQMTTEWAARVGTRHSFNHWHAKFGALIHNAAAIVWPFRPSGDAFYAVLACPNANARRASEPVRRPRAALHAVVGVAPDTHGNVPPARRWSRAPSVADRDRVRSARK